MSYQYVNVVTINKVAVIEFNYGRKLNALSKVFIDDLMQALSDLNRPEIRCIILRAPSGSKVFSAGHDIHELPSGGRDPLSYDDPLRQITRMIQKFPKPIISMVEGSVWGGQTQIDVEAYEERVKDIWLNEWNRLARDLKKIDLYIKPEDGKVYFVVNDNEHGDLGL